MNGARRRALTRIVTAVAVLAVVALVWHHMQLVGDTFWCLAAGDYVLDHHALPTHDPFTFTESSRPWVLTMVAFQVGGAWVMRHMGPFALLALGTAVYSAAHLLVWLRYARTPRARLLTFPVVLLAIQVEWADISVRGQVFADLAFALLLVLLFRIRRREHVPFYAPLLLGIYWTNVHPSFLFGAVLPLAFASADLAEPSPEERGDPRAYLRASALFVLGVGLNPYSFAVFVEVVKLTVNPTTARVDLFNSPDFHDGWWIAALGVSFAILGVLSSSKSATRRRSNVLLWILFFAATCRARRFGPFLLAFEIALFGDFLSSFASEVPARIEASASALVAVVAGAISLFGLREPKVAFANVPAASAELVRSQGLSGHVFSMYSWGGYLEWAWKGTPAIAYDGRNQLFDDGTFDDMTTFSEMGAGWRSMLDMYEADLVVWESGDALDEALAKIPEWREIHRDPTAVVYQRAPLPR